MLIKNTVLSNLDVYTESGEEVGQIIDLTIDTESQSIISYSVKPAKLMACLFKGNLEIKRGQVVDIEADKIIVEDNFDKQKEEKEKTRAAKEEPAILSKEDTNLKSRH